MVRRAYKGFLEEFELLEDGSSKLHYCPDGVYGDIDEDVDPALKGKRQRTGESD